METREKKWKTTRFKLSAEVDDLEEGIVYETETKALSRPALYTNIFTKSLLHKRTIENGNNGTVRPLLRFKRAAKTVVVLLKATSTRQEQFRSEEKQVSLATYQDEILNSRRSNYGNGLSFDPLEYRARKQVNLSNEAKTILSLNPKDRTDEQIRVALLSLQNALDAFCEFPIKMQTSLVKRGWYEHFEAKRVIIRQGHKADNFYMIIDGKTVVTILQPDEKTGHSTTITAAILGRGKSFGELAIMHGAARSATVTCQTDVELLALHRDDFVDIFMHVERNIEPEHIRYLRQVDVLRRWPVERLPWNDTRICLFMFFRRGTIMCKDSNHSEWIYVIKSGSCRVLKSLFATKPDVPGLVDTDYIDLESKSTLSTNSLLQRKRHNYSNKSLVSTTSRSSMSLNSPSSVPSHSMYKLNSQSSLISHNSSKLSIPSSHNTSEVKSQSLVAPDTARKTNSSSLAASQPSIKLNGHSSLITHGNSKLNSPSSMSHGQSPARFLPPIKGAEKLSDDLIQRHKRKLDVIDTEMQYLRMRKGQTAKDKAKLQQGEKIFVQLQKLGPKDTLGLEPIAFEMMHYSTSVSLVSDGVEAILINKKFFLQHLSEDYQRHLRTTLQPYPSDESLQQKLQEETNWNAFKTITVHDFVQNNKFSSEIASY